MPAAAANHAAGDQALKKVAHALKRNLKRSSDFVARYGGEEFAFILPSISFQNAQAFSAQACLAIQSLGMEHKGSSVEEVVTISIGGATTQPSRGSRLAAFTRHVDVMLYQAKEARNRAVWSFFKEN